MTKQHKIILFCLGVLSWMHLGLFLFTLYHAVIDRFHNPEIWIVVSICALFYLNVFQLRKYQSARDFPRLRLLIAAFIYANFALIYYIQHSYAMSILLLVSTILGIWSATQWKNLTSQLEQRFQ